MKIQAGEMGEYKRRLDLCGKTGGTAGQVYEHLAWNQFSTSAVVTRTSSEASKTSITLLPLQ